MHSKLHVTSPQCAVVILHHQRYTLLHCRHLTIQSHGYLRGQILRGFLLCMCTSYNSQKLVNVVCERPLALVTQVYLLSFFSRHEWLICHQWHHVQIEPRCVIDNLGGHYTRRRRRRDRTTNAASASKTAVTKTFTH